MELVFFALDAVLLYAMARRLGPRFALAPVLLFTLDPVLYLNMSEGRSVAILVFLSLGTLWAIWRALDESRWMVVAAVTASLGFLTADAIGYLFLLAGAAGFCWRFYYDRWAILRDRWYLFSIGIFGSVVLAWTSYNYALFGTPITDPEPTST
jgi:hypothetical protein